MNKQQLKDSIRVLNSDIEHIKGLIDKLEQKQTWLNPHTKESLMYRRLLGKLCLTKAKYEFELLEVVQ